MTSPSRNFSVISSLRSLLTWLWTAVFWAVFLTLYSVTFKLCPPSLQMRAIRLWGRSSFRILGIPVHIEGLEHFQKQESRVVVCNHQSALDLLWGATICPPAPLTIGKREVIYIPVLNLLWWAFDFVRIDRKQSAESVAALNRTVEVIQSGRRSLVIAPEGTRTPDGSILPFKRGAFHVALQAHCPIVPVAVHGAYECMSKKDWIARPGKIWIRILSPIVPPPLAASPADQKEQARALTEQVRDQIVKEYQALQARYPLS